MFNGKPDWFERNFDSVIICLLAILVWECNELGIDISIWEVCVPLLIGVVLTVFFTWLKRFTKRESSNAKVSSLVHSDKICSVSIGFQFVCVAWLIIVLRKAHSLEEILVEQILVTALIVGGVIAFSFGVLVFIRNRVDAAGIDEESQNT